jgi:hypothetical protein
MQLLPKNGKKKKNLPIKYINSWKASLLWKPPLSQVQKKKTYKPKPKRIKQDHQITKPKQAKQTMYILPIQKA